MSEPKNTPRFYVETLGCPKNAVDSDKVTACCSPTASARADGADHADLVVVNTCAFIEAARQESIDTILALPASRRPGARLVVTGCMAERYGDELAAALPEVDAVVGFAGEGRSVSPSQLGPSSEAAPAPRPNGQRVSATCSSCRARRRPRRGPT